MGSFVLQRKDLLQLMIDAGDEDTKDGLCTGEIVAEAVGFMLAGYETTSVALTFATYLLAKNPEVQEKLANEIHEYLDENPVSVMLCVRACVWCIYVHYFCAYTLVCVFMFVCVWKWILFMNMKGKGIIWFSLGIQMLCILSTCMHTIEYGQVFV